MQLSKQLVVKYKKDQFEKRFKDFEKYWNVIPKLYNLIKTEIFELFKDDFKEYLFIPLKRWFSATKDSMYVVAKYGDLLFRIIYKFNDYGEGTILRDLGLEARLYCRTCEELVEWVRISSTYELGKQLLVTRCKSCSLKYWNKQKIKNSRKEKKNDKS